MQRCHTRHEMINADKHQLQTTPCLKKMCQLCQAVVSTDMEYF